MKLHEMTTQAGVIEICTLQQLADQLKIEWIGDKKEIDVSALEEPAIGRLVDRELETFPATYTKYTYSAFPHRNRLKRLRAALNHFSTKRKRNTIPNLYEVVEDVSVNSLMHFGAPTHWVELGNNKYALVCIDDFREFRNEAKFRIIGFSPKRNFVVEARGIDWNVTREWFNKINRYSFK